MKDDAGLRRDISKQLRSAIGNVKLSFGEQPSEDTLTLLKRVERSEITADEAVEIIKLKYYGS